MMKLGRIVGDLLYTIVEKVAGGDSLRVIDLTSGWNVSQVVVSLEVFYLLYKDFGSTYKEEEEMHLKYYGVPVHPSTHLHKKEVVLLGGRND